MEGFDQETARLYYRSYSLPGGMNQASPKPNVPPEAATEMSGCLTALGHVIPGFKQSTEMWAGHVSEIPRYIFTYFGYTETLVLLCNTKAYIVTTADAVDKTPATPFTTQTYSIWRGQTLLHANTPVAVVNNYGINVPHYYDGGSGLFVPVTGAPQCKAFCGWVGRMLTANIYVSGVWYVNRLQWSTINNILDWPLTGSSGFLDLADDSDAILRLEMTSGNIVIILRRKSIHLGIPNALVTNPIGTQFLSARGLRAPNSVQKEGNNLYYMGDSDIYRIAGTAEPESIGMAIRTNLFKLADPATLSYVWSFLDNVNKLYYLVVRLLDTTWRAWIFNFEQNSWSMQDFTGISSVGEWYI